MKFSQFNKANLKNLRAEMEALLRKYGADVDVEFTVGSMRFTDTDVKINVEAKVKGAPSQIEQDLVRYMGLYGIKSVEGFGGRRLVGFKANNHTYPFIFEQRGKRYKCSTEQAQLYFGKA